MVAGENKPAAQQTWGELQTYFTEKWLECKQYSATMALKRQRFLHRRQQQLKTKVSHKQCCLQCCRKSRQAIMLMTTNKANMDAMLKRMNPLVTGEAGRCPIHQDKESTPTVGNSLPTLTGSGTTQPKKPKRCKCMCPHCKMFVLHKPKNCVELEANKDKRWLGWRLVHTIA
jgi:hypothetical protein